MSYHEHNRKTLEEALGRLPSYRPPESLWGRIESELAREENEKPLRHALEQLPAYSPPPSVWETVEAGLDRGERQPRIRRLAWLAAAASVAALVAWAVFYLPAEPGIKPVYTYETEEVAPGMFANNWDADEAALRAVVEQFARDPWAKTHNQHGRMLEDWQELEEARAEVKEIMELYGKDARLVRQMGEIERERSRLVKAMATGI
ncbi:MAG: hypothetical protein KDD10_26250 [Phaeodactylibacter sp.]|nr:hypothetical protein [Phaeodactylibacter sp.]